ncbi:hypothetical protein [Burkholderia pseudomallei]|uniref:hypothetical protein n=1 Tax=Burkholderia pseudomallei TaxID=28450 RepID=UPI000B26856F|nr:hypothetical protein [Burkholderia pseudomallei]
MPPNKKSKARQTGLRPREAIWTTLPLSDDLKRCSPEQIILQFGEPVLTIDVGRLCFRRRDFAGRRRKKACMVDPETLSSERIELVRRLIEIAEVMQVKGMRPLTVRQNLVSFSGLVDWVDESHREDLLTEKGARDAVVGYFGYLNGSVASQTLAPGTAAGYQTGILAICRKLFPGSEWYADLELQTKSAPTNAGTIPPSELIQGRQLLLDRTLFTSFSAVALDFPAFPIAVPVPEYLHEPENVLWVFPVAPFFATIIEREKQAKLKRQQRVIDFAAGKIRDKAELLEKFGHRYKARTAVYNAKQRLKSANANRRHRSRLTLGLVAARAFLDMFCATTGMNWSDAVRLPWTGEYTVGAVRQHFRTIKHRAGGKEIEYDIEAIFLPHFKRYLKLREYLLSGVEWPYLFFMGEFKWFGKIKPRLYGHNSSTLLHFQIRLDPTLKPIGNKGWRAAATNHSVDTYGPEVTATRFQKSMRVVQRHYASGTPTQTIIELGGYFEQQEVALRDSRKGRGCQESAVGDCAQPGSPNSIVERPAVVPDCGEPAGCLFCDKYFLVPDERDVRKLFSFRFVINMTKSLSANVSHWSSVHGPILQRIERNIAAISNRSDAHKTLVERVKHEVETLGKLDEYWRSKLQMLNFLSGGALW